MAGQPKRREREAAMIAAMAAMVKGDAPVPASGVPAALAGADVATSLQRAASLAQIEDARQAPVKFSARLAAQIIDRMHDGADVRDVARLPGMPAAATIYDWIERQPDFGQAAALARERQGDFHVSQIRELVNTMTPHTASMDRVKIDALKWLARVANPARYGDHLAVEADVRSTTTTIIAVTDLPPDARAALRAALSAKTIDHQAEG